MNTRNSASLLPCKELIDVLLPAYQPCAGFKGACESMKWSPGEGHIPRGFCGATGKISDVELVLIMAEPGDPHSAEEYSSKKLPQEMFSAVADYAYQCYQNGTDLFHRNVRGILDLFWGVGNPRVRVWVRKMIFTIQWLILSRKRGDKKNLSPS